MSEDRTLMIYRDDREFQVDPDPDERVLEVYGP